MSNFSFSRSVFKRLELQTRKNQGLFGKGLKEYITNTDSGCFPKLSDRFLKIPKRLEISPLSIR